jgi:hypothetical protein
MKPKTKPRFEKAVDGTLAGEIRQSNEDDLAELLS